jgi:hypothetical protein
MFGQAHAVWVAGPHTIGFMTLMCHSTADKGLQQHKYQLLLQD